MKKVLALLVSILIVSASAAALYSCRNEAGNVDNDTTAPTTTAAAGGDETAGATKPETTVGDETTAADIDLQTKVDITTVSGTPGANESEGPANIFDGDSSTKWCALQEGVTVEWKMVEPVKVSYYYFTTANDAPERNPASWVLYGSTDGENWVEIDKVEGATLPTEFFTDSEKYTVDNPQAYEYYKLEITAVAVPGTNVTQFSEFNFYQASEK